MPKRNTKAASKVFFQSAHSYFYHFSFQQPSTTPLMSAGKDCVKMCTIIFVYKQHRVSSLSLMGTLSNVAAQNSRKHFSDAVVQHVV